MRIRKLRTCSVHISPWVELPLWPRLVKSFRAPWIPSCSVASTVNYWFSHWSFLRGHKCLELNWLLSCDNTGTEVRDVENEVMSRILLDLYWGRVLLVEGRQEAAGHGEVVGGHQAGLGLLGGGELSVPGQEHQWGLSGESGETGQERPAVLCSAWEDIRHQHSLWWRSVFHL